MALAPLRRCSKPGCRVLVRGESRCERHAQEWNRESGKNKSGDPFYSGKRWRRLRAAKLQNEPLCAKCFKQGKVTAANEVHHVKPRLQHPELSYEWGNLECLCKSCHSRETGKERAGRV